MKLIFSSILVGLGALVGHQAGAAELVRRVEWSPNSSALDLPQVNLAEDCRDDEDCLVVHGSRKHPLYTELLAIDDPDIDTATYAVLGRVSTSDVEGRAYLVLLSRFDGGREYFTKTLESSGPLRDLEGSSDWRWFALPFHVTADGDAEARPRPRQLELGLQLPGAGQVRIGALELRTFAPGEDPLAAVPGGWLDPQTSGLIGGILGATLGLIGALIGLLSSRRRARRLTLGLVTGIGVLGLLFLVAGVTALAASQPYEIYYPALLTGAICTVAFLFARGPIRKRYAGGKR